MQRPVRIAAGVAIVAAIAASAAAAQAVRPSFECRRASFADERAICADDRLAQMDQAESLALGMIGKDTRKMAREDAFAKLANRHACGPNRVCILDNQAVVLDMLRDYGARVPMPPWIGEYRAELVAHGEAPMTQGLPKVVGTCTRTKIAGLATRFGETLKAPDGPATNAGTSVELADGGHQVSYGYEPAAGASAIGDPVIVCLVSIPTNCPAGDTRGRFYSTTNVRTGGWWIMPDAEHMCGGA